MQISEISVDFTIHGAFTKDLRGKKGDFAGGAADCAGLGLGVEGECGLTGFRSLEHIFFILN